MFDGSKISLISLLPERERNEFFSKLTRQEKIHLAYDWSFFARPNQISPNNDWSIWLIQAGRGFGKTRCGSEWVRKKAIENPGCRIALVGRTVADTRDVMAGGESGIKAISPSWDGVDYTPSNRCIKWSNGSIAYTYSADKPDQLRGPQHHFAWADELASWRYLDAWDQLMFGLRLGDRPQCVVTTTPKPKAILRELNKRKDCVVTRGSSYDNKNWLPDVFYSQIVSKYEGTTLGRQELYAELLEEIPGALWTRKTIDSNRILPTEVPQLSRIVVAIDPAVTSNENSDETGIIACGRDFDGIGYVLKDVSGILTPDGWGKRAVELFHKLRADRIVAEVNQGGDMVEKIIRSIDQNISYTSVRASRGKMTRAEPVSALYEQNKVKHAGIFEQLEDQMCNYVGDNSERSPDRMDALVHGMTFLFENEIEIPMSFSSDGMTIQDGGW